MNDYLDLLAERHVRQGMTRDKASARDVSPAT
jgi:hypothetical protein